MLSNKQSSMVHRKSVWNTNMNLLLAQMKVVVPMNQENKSLSGPQHLNDDLTWAWNVCNMSVICEDRMLLTLTCTHTWWYKRGPRVVPQLLTTQLTLMTHYEPDTSFVYPLSLYILFWQSPLSLLDFFLFVFFLSSRATFRKQIEKELYLTLLLLRKPVCPRAQDRAPLSKLLLFWRKLRLDTGLAEKRCTS